MKRAPLITLVMCALWTASHLSAAADLRPDAADVEEARAHYTRGLQLYGDSSYPEARAELEKAYALAPTYRLLYELALASAGQGDRGAAIRYLQRYLAEGGAHIEASRRSEAEELLKDLRARVALVTIRTNVSGGATVTVDDALYGDVAEGPFVLVPGSRRIWVTRAGYYPASQVVLLKEGDAIDLSFTLKELPRANAESSPWWRKAVPPVFGVLVASALAVAFRRKTRRPSLVRLNPYELDADARVSKPTPAQTNVIDVDGGAATSQLGAPLTLTAGVATDVGRVKQSNEDSHLLELDKKLFAVCDGIGGFAGGDIASATAVETIEAYFQGQSDVGLLTHLPSYAADLASAVFAANAAIRHKQVAIPNLADMGCTCVTARFSLASNELAVVHVGDSRLYRLRGGGLEQLTTDHTMAELGVTGRRAQHLSRALGTEASPKVDVLLLRFAPGDVYLLCCDGLTKMLSDEAIARLLQTDSSPDLTASNLVAAANDAGGRDNITALVIKIHPHS